MSAGQKQTLAQVPMAPRHFAERQMAKSVLPNISWLKVILPKAILPKVILPKVSWLEVNWLKVSLTKVFLPEGILPKDS